MAETNHKVCFKCGRNLPIDFFYAHPQMRDGHLNKCKTCTKNDVHENYMAKIDDSSFVDKERKRGRDKYHRLYKGKMLVKQYHCTSGTRRFILLRYPSIQHDTELHHWNYNMPRSVFVLSKRTHARLHKLISYDDASKMFVLKSTGEILDTKEKHEAVIDSIEPYNWYLEH